MKEGMGGRSKGAIEEKNEGRKEKGTIEEKRS